MRVFELFCIDFDSMFLEEDPKTSPYRLISTIVDTLLNEFIEYVKILLCKPESNPILLANRTSLKHGHISAYGSVIYRADKGTPNGRQ